MIKYCCCTGHRPKGFPFKYGIDKNKHNAYIKMLEHTVESAIAEYGITNFISGMAIGVDLDFAEIVIELRKKYPIKLECAIPCPNQTLKWNDADKLRYTKILECADETTVVSERYTFEFNQVIPYPNSISACEFHIDTALNPSPSLTRLAFGLCLV